MSSRAAPPAVGRLVDVGRYRLHLACQGEGSPTVVMEAAIGETGLLWSLVQPAVAQRTRACVYDRAGLGWSDPSPRPRTAALMVQELHALLATAHVPGPYVLVGHSFGGLLVRLYAARHPEEVAGLVLVDSAHEDQYRQAPREIRELLPQVEDQTRQQFQGLKALMASGSLDPAVLPVPPQLPGPAADSFRALVAAGPRHVDTFMAEQEAVGAIHAELAAAQITSLGDLPMVVLSHGQPMAMPGLTDAVNQAYEQLWQDLQAQLVGLSSRGRLVVAQDSGHYIQLERPELVVDAIVEVVAAARTTADHTGSAHPAAGPDAAKEGTPLTDQAQPETTIAFVLYPGLTPLDLIGPLQVFTTLGTYSQLGLPVPPTRTVVVGERLEPMDSDTPVKLTPSATFDQVPDPTIVIVPGGGMPTVRAAGNEAILSYVRSAAETAQVCASVCTGALILAAAGLLEGRPATTHWAYWRLLEKLGARYVPEQRWVEDGKFITSAGVSAGIDMALHLTERLTDESTARMVQLGIEYDPKPPHGGIAWNTVNRDIYAPVIAQQLPATLADKPELLHRLTD